MKISFPRAVGIARLLAANSLLCVMSVSGQEVVTYFDDMDVAVEDTAARHVLNVPLFAPLFATPADAHAFGELSRPVYDAPVPDARAMAQAFLNQHLAVDGDAYVVAHFASEGDRAKGSPDHTQKLTDALMEAFPEHARHTFFAEAADAVGGINGGGEKSPGVLAFVEGLAQGRTAGDVLKRAGAFLWSRTGPGYIYNTFFASGNVVETVAEDRRTLDSAFGIFHAGKGFSADSESSLRLSRLVEEFEHVATFAELPYVKALNGSLDAYWAANGRAWTVVARYRFVWEARKAQALGYLSRDQLAHVLGEGAAHIALDGPVALAHLRSPSPSPSRVRRFDINGHASTDMVRFIAADGSEVLYVPGGERPFVAFANEGALRNWVAETAKSARGLDELLSHFSLYDRQDGIFRTGVAHALEKIASGAWTADASAIDRADAIVAGDLFEDMRARVERRMRDDARVQASTAWEAWRETIGRTTTLLAPLGYVPALALPIQAGSALVGVGTGVEQGIHGRTLEARRGGFNQAVVTAVTAVPLGAAFAAPGGHAGGEAAEASAEGAASFVRPSRVNGRIGYPMSPMRAPFLPTGEADGEAGGIPPRPPVTPSTPVLDTVAPEESRPPFIFADVETELRSQGYISVVVRDDAGDRVSRTIAWKKAEIDGRRHQLDDFRIEDRHVDEHGERVVNAAGRRAANHALVYRVDSRSPRQLLSMGGFGPGKHFYALPNMLPGDASIGSGSLAASNVVFRHWNDRGFAGRENFNQYAVWTEGREVVSALDNLDPTEYEIELDEVHFPADVPAKDIFLIDSYDPEVRKAIAEIVESKHVSTPYGVPLEAFVKYMEGALDIHGPNAFSERRLRDDVEGPAARP